MNRIANPYLDQRRWRLRNRLAGWRAAPAEPLFQLFAAAALLGLAGLLLSTLLREHGAALLAAWQRHLGSAAAALVLLAWFDSRRRLAEQRRQWQRGWLAAQPVLPSAQRRALAALLLRRLTVAALILAGLLTCVARAGLTLPFGPVATALIALGAGAALAWLGDRPAALPVARHGQAAPSDRLAGRGTLWRWQLVAVFAARRASALAPGLWLLLLLPMGGYDLRLVLAILLTVLLLAAFVAAWRYALRTIVEAAGWLAPQPWPASAWLRACLPLPLALLAIALLLLAPATVLIGPLPTALAMAGLAAVALLQLLLTIAERRRPRRIGPALLLHLGLLFALAASLPPLLPLLWLAQVGWLLRRIRRS